MFSKISGGNLVDEARCAIPRLLVSSRTKLSGLKLSVLRPPR